MHVHTPPACKEIAQKQEFTSRLIIKKTPVEKGKVNKSISSVQLKTHGRFGLSDPKLLNEQIFANITIQ